MAHGILSPVSTGIHQLKYIDDSGAAAATYGWIPLWADGIKDVTWHYEWTSTLGLTINVDISNDPRCLEGHFDAANADTDDITAQLTITAPTTGGGDAVLNIDNLNFSYVRWRTTSVTGAGNLTSYFNGTPG